MLHYVTKKLGDKIMKEVPAILSSMGFVSLPTGSWHDYTKQSQGGKVEISVRYERAYRKRGYSICIFGVFADSAKACWVGINCNEFSGKYNHLYIQSIDQLKYCLGLYK